MCLFRNNGYVDKWKGNEENQRQFFDDFAKKFGFHPEKEYTRWYTVSATDICKMQVCTLLLN